jgi:hypothetical protein
MSVWSSLVDEARARGVWTATLTGSGVRWPDGATTPVAEDELAAIVGDLSNHVLGPERDLAAFQSGVMAAIRAGGFADEVALTGLLGDVPPPVTLQVAADVEVHAAVVTDGIALRWHSWDDVPVAPDPVRGLLDAPHGIVAVTGPGRRPMVRALSRALVDRHTWALVDQRWRPVPGLRHVDGPVDTLAARIRSALRWDPDALVVAAGPPECWPLVVQAALTGHLVLLEVEEPDPFEAMRRSGLDPVVVASAARATVHADGSEVTVRSP